MPGVNYIMSANNFWLLCGLGLLVMTLGATWVIQSKLINCPAEQKAKFTQRLIGSGYMVMAMGIIYIVLGVVLRLR